MDGISKKKWELTKEAFDRFLSCLDPDREQAGRQYQLIREKLKLFFEHRGCPYPDELIDETLNRVMRRVLGGEALRKPSAYCGGVAWKVLQEYWDSHGRLETGLDSVPTGSQPVADPDAEQRERGAMEYEERRRACQRECVRLLEATDRDLIVPYVNMSKTERLELGTKLEISVNLLRLKVFRIRQRLQECTNQCLKSQGLPEIKF